MAVARYHVTVLFPAGITFYTDQWNVDEDDGWTVQQFFEDMCASLKVDASAYWLLKNGLPLIGDELVPNSVGNGETVSLVPA